MYKNELLTPVAVVQSDTVNLTRPFKGIWVTIADAAGDTLSVVTLEDTTVVITLPPRAAGAAYPVFFEMGIKRVNATNTTLDDAEMIGVR